MTDQDVDRIAVAVEARLAPRFERLEEGFKALKRAIIILADSFPGSLPGQKSHVRRKVEEALN